MTEKKHPTKKDEKKEECKTPKVKDLTPGKDPSGGKREPKYP